MPLFFSKIRDVVKVWSSSLGYEGILVTGNSMPPIEKGELIDTNPNLTVGSGKLLSLPYMCMATPH